MQNVHQWGSGFFLFPIQSCHCIPESNLILQKIISEWMSNNQNQMILSNKIPTLELLTVGNLGMSLCDPFFLTAAPDHV